MSLSWQNTVCVCVCVCMGGGGRGEVVYEGVCFQDGVEGFIEALIQ